MAGAINPLNGPGFVLPFPFATEPLTQITPFSYRDGMTYAKMLEGLRVYLNAYIVPEFNGKMEEIVATFQEGLDNAEQTVITTRDEWQALFTAFMENFEGEIKLINDGAIAELVVEDDSQTYAALHGVFATIAYVNSQIAGVGTRIGAVETIIDTGRLSTTEINKLATKTALAQTDATVLGNTNAIVGIVTDNTNTKGRVTELERIYTVAPIDAVFIGDSYFTGYQPIPTPWIKSVPEIVTELLNKAGLNSYVMRNFAGNAGGYDSSIGGGDTSFQKQVTDAIAANYTNCRLIVFGGGRNDSNTGKDVKTKARSLYTQMRTKYPMAKIVVVPFWDYTRFQTGQRDTFSSIFQAAKEEGCVYNVNSLWVAGVTPAEDWIDSIPHPKLSVATTMANAVFSLIQGGSLPGLSHKYYVRPSSGFTGGVATIEGMTCTVTIKNEIGADFGSSYVIGTLDPIFRPGNNVYSPGYSGNGTTINLYQVVATSGDIGLQASTGGKAGLSGLAVSYGLGSI